jgi:hypothetical protein
MALDPTSDIFIGPCTRSFSYRIQEIDYCSLFLLISLQLIDWLLYYVPLKNFSLLWRRHHCRWRAVKFRPMLGAQGLWAGRDLYRATPTVTRDLGFSGLIRMTAPFSRLLPHTWGGGGSIVTRILIATEIYPQIFYVGTDVHHEVSVLWLCGIYKEPTTSELWCTCELCH